MAICLSIVRRLDAVCSLPDLTFFRWYLRQKLSIYLGGIGMAADRVGQQLGNYRLIRLLGQGGFAEVYLGEHIHLGTQAAIKLLRTQLTSEAASTFRNEARTLARLVHPHIVRVFDFGI